MSEYIQMLKFLTRPDTLQTKNMFIISLEYTLTQIIKCIIFLMHTYVAAIHLNYRGQRIQNTQFALYISDTPVTMKQSQGHQPKMTM